MNSFFLSQFSYCPLVWMFDICTINNKINCLHERCFHIVHWDKTLFFEELFRIRWIYLNAAKMFKLHMNEAAPKLSSLFESHNTRYKLGNVTNFSIPYVGTAFMRTENLSLLDPKYGIWSQLK